MYNKNKRVVSQPPPSRNAAASTAAASAAASLAFAKKQQADAGLSAAAAAAALRSHATTPVPISEIQTKRMARRGSTSSFGSNAGSIRQAFGRPGLQRRTSSSSMTERTFRSPSPGPNRRRAPSISSISEIPSVPALPSKTQTRPANYEPQMRTSMASPTPSTGSRLPVRKNTPGGSLAGVPEQREREYVESIDSRRSVNFSRPMSPPPMATAQRETVRMRPASSQGFYTPQNSRVQQQQQPAQAARQAPAAVKKVVKPPRADSILEEATESPPSRNAASAAARPASTTPRTKMSTGPAPTNLKTAMKPAAQTSARPNVQAPAKPAARPASTGPQSTPKPASRPASAMSAARQPMSNGSPQYRTQPPQRPASAMSQSRADQPAWPPSALAQKVPQSSARPASAMSHTQATRNSTAVPAGRGDIGGTQPQRGPIKVTTGVPTTRTGMRPSSAAGQSTNAPITVPSPTQEQMRTFQTRTNPVPQAYAAATVGDRREGSYQPTRPVTATRTSTSSITTQQRDRSTSQPVTNLVPAANFKRTPSASPARSARFSTAPLLDAVKHKPPPRATSPAKSALKPASLRTSSPESSYRQGTSDNSDSRSVVSVESSSKKKKAVNFDENPRVLAPAKGLTSSTKSMWMAEAAPELSRTPALPSFESVRGRKIDKDSNAESEPTVPQLDTEAKEMVPQYIDQAVTSASTSLPNNVMSESARNYTAGQTGIYEHNYTAEGHQIEITTSQDAIKTNGEDVPHISVLPATPRTDEHMRSFGTADIPATILDDSVVTPSIEQKTTTSQPASSYHIPGPYEHDLDRYKSTSVENSNGDFAPIVLPESNTQEVATGTVLPGAYTPSRIRTSFAPGTTTYASSGLPSLLGLFAPSSPEPPAVSGPHTGDSTDSKAGQGEAAHEFVNSDAEHTDELLEPNTASVHDVDGDAGEMEDGFEATDGENKPLSAIYEGPAVEHLRDSDTHPAFRSSNIDGERTIQQTMAPPPEEDWERVRAYWSSLSEQRKQQLEHEAGIIPPADEQLGSSESAQERDARFEPSPPRHIPRQAESRYAGNQAPLPPWPDQQYQQSVRRNPPPRQQGRPSNQRIPSDPPNGRPQSAYAEPKRVPPVNIRPASVSGESPTKTVPAQTNRPLKGVLKNANAPQPPLARTFSNDSSGSDSSFKKERQQRRRGNSSHSAISMKKTMRAPTPQSTGSYEGRAISPTPARGNRKISPSPSRTSQSRPLRMSMRAPAPVEAGPVVNIPDPVAPKQAPRGPIAPQLKPKAPSKGASRFRSRFDDSSDEDDARPAKRKIVVGGFGKSSGMGGFGKGGGGFRSRFGGDSDDEDMMGSPNGHAQGSSLMSGTMRNSIDGSPKKRNLFGGLMKKGEAGVHEADEVAPTSPSRQSKMLGTMRQSEPDLPQASSRPSVFRRLSLSRSSASIPGTASADNSVPVPPIPDLYKQSSGGNGGLLAAKVASTKPPLLSNESKEEIFSSRTGKKKRFQGLRRAFGLND